LGRIHFSRPPSPSRVAARVRAGCGPQEPLGIVGTCSARLVDETAASSTEVIGYLEHSLEAGSVDRGDALLLARLYAADHREAAAIHILQKAAGVNPYVPEFVEALAALYLKLGQYRTTQTLIEKGLQLFPEDASLRQMRTKAESASLTESASLSDR
jgi:tetratricopeptide (TPR) repeat protein